MWGQRDARYALEMDTVIAKKQMTEEEIKLRFISSAIEKVGCERNKQYREVGVSTSGN